MSRIELHRLRYFVAVAQERSFSRAAERLNIAQPPLSLQIRKLEDEIGVELLRRTKTRVEVTFAGQLFLIEAQATLAQAAHAVDVARRASRGEVGALTVGYCASADLSILAEVVPAFRRQYPEVRLSFQALFQSDQVAKLHDETIDVGVLRLPVGALDGLGVAPILRERFVAVLPEHHRLAGRESVQVQDLEGETYIIFPRRFSPGMYDTVTQALDNAGLDLELREMADHIQFNLSLVAMGEGVSLLPESVRQLQRRGVVYVPVAEPSLSTELGMIFRDSDSSETLRNFLELAQEVFPPQPITLPPRHAEPAPAAATARRIPTPPARPPRGAPVRTLSFDERPRRTCG